MTETSNILNISMVLDIITLVIALIGCLIGVLNFLFNVRQRKAERKCLINCRNLYVNICNLKIESIVFRFYLSNITDKSILLREIYLSHPLINNGERIYIDQIGEVKFLFSQDKVTVKRGSQYISPAKEVLPYMLKPNSTYEGYARIDSIRNAKQMKSISEVGETLNVFLLFDRLYKYSLPIQKNMNYERQAQQ